MSTIKVNTLTTLDGTGNITFDRPIVGDASGLTGVTVSKAAVEALGIELPAANLTGTVADARFPATLPAASGANLTSLPAANLTGTVADARFPATLPASSGVNLTALNASNISSGTLPAGRYTDTVYTHPTTAGNKHIPSGGATDQVLTYSSSGTAAWADPAGGGVDGITSSADATAITIDSSERVGVGTTTPPYTLTVRETSTSAGTYYPIGVCGANHQTGYGVGIAFRPENAAQSQKAKVAIISEGTSQGNNKAGLHIALSDTANTTTEVSLADSVLEFTVDGRAVSEFTARAWINFNGTGTVAIRDSHNVSSITDVGSGRTTVTFASAMSSGTYSACSTAARFATSGMDPNRNSCCNNITTSSFVVTSGRASHGDTYDVEVNTAQVFGD